MLPVEEHAMRIGFIGLGKMGLDMVRRLLHGGHQVAVYDQSAGRVQEAITEGATGAQTLDELAQKLPLPRSIWVMTPAGEVTAQIIQSLGHLLTRGDTIIEGGNSYYKDDVTRADKLRAHGVHYLDVGTSGGIWGLEEGYCLMIGGEQEVFEKHRPIFATLAPQDGYVYVGSHGAGHYVKMIHNGIEYGLMQAYAEGVELLYQSEFGLDLPAIARVWMHGSVVRSWLLELTAAALARDPALAEIADYVEDSGEGRWTVFDAIEKDVPAPVITQALFARFRSRQGESFASKLLAALRREFGGHAVKTKS
jgi:6-phosphogluconate dehydrogenase